MSLSSSELQALFENYLQVEFGPVRAIGAEDLTKFCRAIANGVVDHLDGRGDLEIGTTVYSSTSTVNKGEISLYSAGSNFTLRAPSSPVLGDAFGLKEVGGGTFTVTVDGNGKQIDGPGSVSFSPSIGVATPLQALMYRYDGTRWILMAQN